VIVLKEFRFEKEGKKNSACDQSRNDKHADSYPAGEDVHTQLLSRFASSMNRVHVEASRCVN
jgi:hypothetical protein